MGESYWQRDASWRDQWHDAPLPAAADFAIIGGGLAGLATAIRLRELHAGATIVVLEAERVGYGASGRNAGFLSPLAAPVWLLGADRSRDQAWAARRINADVHDVARWIEQRLPAAELAKSRMLLEATGRISDAGLGQFARAVEAVGLAHQLEENSAGHRSLQMDAYTVHPYALVRGLAQQAAHAGVRIREQARVRSIEGERLRLDEGGTLNARRIIICTNAYTGTLDVGERIHALVIHAFLMASQPTTRTDDGAFTVVLDRDQAFVRMHERRILYGGGDKLIAPRGDDYAVPDAMRARLAQQMQRRFPGTDVAEAWAGKFHATVNGLPIIRPSKTNRAVILNVGYGGTGVALALVCARLAAAVASDGLFITADDARLLSIMQRTRISVRDLARAAVGLVR